MTTLEFAKKNLEKARGNLKRAKLKTGTTEEEMTALDEKIVHWANIVDVLEKTACKVIVTCKAMLKPDVMDMLRKQVIDQYNEGFIILPQYCSTDYIMVNDDTKLEFLEERNDQT